MATQRVPAWKRLGLKLKPAGPQAEALSTPSAPQRPGAAFQRDGFDSPKRKREQVGDSPAARPSLKKPKTDDRQASAPLRRQKSVSFAEGADSKKRAAPEPKKAKSTPKKKKAPKTAKPEEPSSPPDLTVPLEYLRLWRSSRDSWKFNKNHQAHLISHAFDSDLFPAADVDTFYDYIGDLKGYARTRLLEAAKKICTEDMDDEKDHFPTGTADVESKKKQYEEILSNILRRSKTDPKRKHFREVDFTSRDAHPEVARRVAKRMRAEIVSEELSSESDGGDEAEGSKVATTGEKEPLGNEAPEEPDVGKRVKLNDGTTRPVKRVRASKRRGADLDDSSSDSSDSNSDSDSESDDESGSGSGSSDSSSDSSDDSDDDDMDVDAGTNDQDTSSSSSSSSNEEEDSDEDSDSDGD